MLVNLTTGENRPGDFRETPVPVPGIEPRIAGNQGGSNLERRHNTWKAYVPAASLQDQTHTLSVAGTAGSSPTELEPIRLCSELATMPIGSGLATPNCRRCASLRAAMPMLA